MNLYNENKNNEQYLPKPVSINSKFINKADETTRGLFNSNFVYDNLTRQGLGEQLNQGFAFCTVFKGSRTQENFVKAGYIALDFDGDWALEEALNDEFIKKHAAIIYTTPSHGKNGKDRFRVIFELETIIEDGSLFKDLLLALLDKFPQADSQCKDSIRFFYGSKGSNPIILEGLLTDTVVNKLISDHGSQSTSKKPNTELIGTDTLLIQEGERNSTLFNNLSAYAQKGILGDELKTLAQSINKTIFDPPLENREVESVFNSVNKHWKEKHSTDGKSVREITEALRNDHLFLTHYHLGTEILRKFDGKVWKEVPQLPIKQMVRNDYDIHSNPRKCQEVYIDLKTASYKEDINWRNISQDHIPLKDYILDCKNDYRIEYKPEFYLKNHIEHCNYEPDAKSPFWDACLSDWFSKNGELDLDKVNLLHEYIGYCLTHKAALKKCLICVGEPNTGKSLIGSLLTAIIGYEFVSNTKIHKFNDEFGSANLPDKLVNIDDEPKVIGNKPLDESSLKMIVGSNPRIEINKKNAHQQSEILVCKLLILANKLPRIDDLSGASFERILMLRFENTIPIEKQDPELLDKLRNEIPGIVAKSIQAYSNLVKRGYIFTESDSSKEALVEYQRDNDPIYQFLEFALVKDSNQGDLITNESLYTAYQIARNKRLISDIELPKLNPKQFATQVNKIEGYKIDSHYSSLERKTLRGIKGFSFTKQMQGGINNAK